MNKLVLPNYEHCILNTITSILKYYNVEKNHKSLEKLDNELKKKYKNVVLLQSMKDKRGKNV